MSAYAANVSRAMNESRLFSPSDRASVTINECHEPLVDISDSCTRVRVRLRVAARFDYVKHHQLFVRQSVAGMLDKLSQAVPYGLHLSIFDAYRPLDYQAWRHNMIRDQLAEQFQDISEEQLTIEADKLVARPDDRPQYAPPHSTGGAVDMLLENADGTSLDFGSQPSVFGPGQNELHPTFASVGKKARSNRDLLLTLASEVGFANFVGEWWHFSYGDQEWALYTNSGSAVYGRADLINNRGHS